MEMTKRCHLCGKTFEGGDNRALAATTTLEPLRTQILKAADRDERGEAKCPICWERTPWAKLPIEC